MRRLKAAIGKWTNGISNVRRSALVRSSLGLGGLTLTSLLLGLVTSVLLARELGAEGLGIYSLALAVVTLAALPLDFGLPSLVVRETAHASSAEDTGAAQAVILFAISFIAVVSAIVVPIILLITAIPIGGFADAVRAIIPIAVLRIPLNSLMHTLGATLAGREMVALGHFPSRLVQPGCFALAIGLAALEPGWLTPARAMALQMAAIAIAATIAAVLSLWFNKALWHRRTPVSWRAWLLATFRLGVSNGTKNASEHIILVLAGALATADAVGLLRVAQRATGLVIAAGAIVVAPAIPRMARLFAENSNARLQRLLKSVARSELAIFLVGLAVFYLGGQWLLGTLFGPDFTGAWGILIVLMTGHAIGAVFGTGDILMNMARREIATVWGHALSLMVTVALAGVLIPIIGIIGAASARALGLVIARSLLWHRARSELGLDPAIVGRVAEASVRG